MTTIQDGYALLHNNTGKSWWGCLSWIADGINVINDDETDAGAVAIGYRIDWGDGTIEWIQKRVTVATVVSSLGESPDTPDYGSAYQGTWENRWVDHPDDGMGSYYAVLVKHQYLAAGTYDVEVTAHWWSSTFYMVAGVDPPTGSEPRGSYTHVAATTTRPARTHFGSKLTLSMQELNEAYDPDAPDNSFFVSGAFADLRTTTVAAAPGIHGVTAQDPWGRWRGGYWEFGVDYPAVGIGDDLIGFLYSGDDPAWSEHADDTLWLGRYDDQLTRLDNGGPTPLWSEILHYEPYYTDENLAERINDVLGVDADGHVVMSWTQYPVDDPTAPAPQISRLLLLDPADRSIVELTPPVLPDNRHEDYNGEIHAMLSDEEVLIQTMNQYGGSWVWNFVTGDIWLLHGSNDYGFGPVAAADGGVIFQGAGFAWRVPRSGRDNSTTGKYNDIIQKALPNYTFAYDSDYGGSRPYPVNTSGFPDNLGYLPYAHGVITDDTDPDTFYLPVWIEPDVDNQRTFANRFQGPAWPDGWDDRHHTRWVTAIYRGHFSTGGWARVGWLQHPYPWWNDGNYDRVRHLYPAAIMRATDIPAGDWEPEPNPPTMVATMAVAGGPRYYIGEPVTATMHANWDDTGALVEGRFVMDWDSWYDYEEHEDVDTEHTYSHVYQESEVIGSFGSLPTEDEPIMVTIRAIPRHATLDRNGVPASATIALYPHRLLTSAGPQRARFNPRPALGGQ